MSHGMYEQPHERQMADAPIGRETTGYAPPPAYPPEGYGYGGPAYGGRMRSMGMSRGWRTPGGDTETRPFFTTSEFLATLLGVIAVAITAAVAADVDSHLGIQLIAGLVAAYTISRGIAKAGTRSHSWDPREELTHRMSEQRSHEPVGDGHR